MIKLDNNFITVEIEKLDWDTNHFGIVMASMTIRQKEKIHSKSDIDSLICEAMDMAHKEGIEHVTVKLASDSKKLIHSCEDRGFRLMDTRVEFIFDYKDTKIIDIKNQCIIREGKAEDEEKLVSISIESFSNYIDRFHSDEKIDNVKADKLYELWVRNSYKGYADSIIIAEVEGEIVGFSTFKEFVSQTDSGEKIGEIVLSAVSKKARGKGVYTSMINEGVKMGLRRMNYLLVKTQIDNIAVQKAWASLGFKPYRSEYIFHYSR
jgi:ribosomal protein S18 acetylase RimI-like enzyme